jgi:prepilin peptidase CpaA
LIKPADAGLYPVSKPEDSGDQLNPLLFALMLSIVITAAIVTDIRSRRIPNSLIIAGWVIAVIWHTLAAPGKWAFDPVSPGASGALGSTAALFSLLLIFLPLYLIRVMGAGDVKLMSVIGAFFGASVDAWTQLPAVALFVFISGGLLALARSVLLGQAGKVFSNVRMILIGYRFRVAGVAGPVFDAQTDSVDRMPYAIAIGVGTVAYLAGRWNGLVSW